MRYRDATPGDTATNYDVAEKPDISGPPGYDPRQNGTTAPSDTGLFRKT